MEKLELEKVIERLKKADLEMWEVEGNEFDTKYLSSRPRFKMIINGITFDVRTCANMGEFTTKYYYSLSIEYRNRKFEIVYDDRKNHAEQNRLKDFYEYLFPLLRKREEEKLSKERDHFKQVLDDLLSE